MAACEDCGRTIKGTPRTSITGRKLCASCADGLLGATAGVLASGGSSGSDGSTSDPVTSAISVRGWFQRLRGHKSAK